MTRHRPHAFTLVELLVVISIISVLIALVLPGLTHARESANHVKCLSNQKHLVQATFAYLGDHDGIAPPGEDKNNKSWCDTLMPWVDKNENVYDCPINFVDKGKQTDLHVSYCPNGFQWLFYAGWHYSRGAPTNVYAVKSPSKLMMMREDTEDWARTSRSLYQSYSYWRRRHGKYLPALFYFHATKPGHLTSGGRHFRGGGGGIGGGRGKDPWGFDTISFYDGHVITESMHLFVQREAVDTYWFEFPFVPAAGQSNSYYISWAPKGPQPGALWWTYPGW